MKQSPSENQQENRQPSTELEAEVEQLSNIASNLAIDSEMQAKIQSLLAHIKISLQQQQLSIEMQRELARLISLISTLDYRNPQQIHILDLAISTLLENKEDTTKNFKNSNFLKKASDRNCRNLVFVQEARRQIAVQSREYPSPFRTISSIIFKGSGGAYNRLISGLSWFFIIFVLCPILGGGLGFLGRSVAIDIAKTAQNEKIQKLEEQLSNTQTKLQDTTETRNKLKASLIKVIQEIDSLNQQSQKISTPDNVNIKKIETQLTNIQKNIQQDLKSVDIRRAAANYAPQPNVARNQVQNSSKQSFFDSQIYFILVAVSMGALGSSISIIVRYNKFIEQSKEGQSDLFFTGFFRPIVGMSFAIFAVALIESGVFSGVFTIAKSENRNVYLYMAIAFIAGFSERLVEDVVLRTEDTLTGYSSRSNKPNK